jgi:hypothetical protein
MMNVTAVVLKGARLSGALPFSGAAALVHHLAGIAAGPGGAPACQRLPRKREQSDE